MLQIQIDQNNNGLHQLAAQLSDKKLTIATVRSINTAISKAQTQYKRLVAGKYNLKFADTKELLLSKRATYSNPEGTISSELRPLSLFRFNPEFEADHSITGKKGYYNAQQRRIYYRNHTVTHKTKGVTVEIFKGKRIRLPFAFMVPNSKKPGIPLQVWARGTYEGGKFVKSKPRLPITPIKSTSPFAMVTNPEVKAKIQTDAQENARKEFERQVNYLLSR